eukprot:766842-Hanusia_phi.AAC.3
MLEVGESLQQSDINKLNQCKQESSNSEVDSQFSTSECTKGSETTASVSVYNHECRVSDMASLASATICQRYAVGRSVEPSSGQSSGMSNPLARHGADAFSPGEDDLDSYNSSDKQIPSEDDYPLHVKGDKLLRGPCRFSKKVMSLLQRETSRRWERLMVCAGWEVGVLKHHWEPSFLLQPGYFSANLPLLR